MDPVVTIYSLFGPFLVWPVEYLFPYPFVIEEIFKLIVVQITRGGVKSYALGGVMFALTETILYTINVNTIGSVGYMFIRFGLTSLLHGVTFVIIYYFARRKLAPIGLTGAMVIHFLYNSLINNG
jgi:hypothetical protein